MFDTTYTDMINHMNFLESMIEEEQEMQDYVNECIILSNPNKKKVFNELASFNEGAAGDKIKGLFARLKSFFSKIWQKFLEKLNAWAQDNKKYLETYKDIIIGKKITLTQVKMQNHFAGKAKIDATLALSSKFAIPIDWEGEIIGDADNGIIANAKGNIDKDDEGKNTAYNDFLRKEYDKVFNAAAISGIDIKEDENLNAVSSLLTNFFNGGEEVETYDTNDIQDKIKIMFNSVYSYNEYVDGLNKIKENYISGMDKTEKVYDSAFTKMSTSIKQLSAANAGSDNDAINKAKENKEKVETGLDEKLSKANQEAKNNEKNTSTTAQNSGFVYSRIYKSYVNEAEVATSNSSAGSGTSKPSTTIKAGGNNTNTSTSQASAKTVGDVSKAQSATVKTNTGNNAQAGVAAKKAANSVDTAKLDSFQAEANNLIRAYSTVRTTVFGSMLTALQSMRNDYMTVIRAHVNSYLGQVNNTDQNTNNTNT